MNDFHFVKKTDKASAKLLTACCVGEHIKTAPLVCRKAGKDQQEFLTYTFTDLLVSSFQSGGSRHSDVIPIDQFSLNFSKIECEYKEQNADGTLLNKLIKVVPQVNQTLGIPEKDFLALGAVGRDNPACP